MELTTWIVELITEIGGISAVVIFFLKRLIDIKMDFISKNYELRMSKELEKYIDELDNKSHKYRAFFDKKIAAHNEVLKSLIPCFKAIKQIMPNGNHGINCEIEICDLESLIVELKKSIENNLIMLDENIIDKLSSLINCFNNQILAYRNILSESENDEIYFSVSLDDLNDMEKEIFNMFRDYCNNLEVITS